MGFVAPAFAAFAVLAGVPILIHLFGRPQARRRPFAAIHFLLKSERKSAPQRKLREVLLLAARALAIAAIPLILAKPYMETISDLPGAMGASEAAVIVLDDSRSMGMQTGSGGKTLFLQAQAKAQKLVDSMGRDSEAAVLLTSQGATPPVGELSADRARLKHAIAAVHATRRPGDTTAALKRAAALLAASPRGTRRVYLVSDLAVHGFSAETPWAKGGPGLVPVDVIGDVAGNGGSDASARRNRAVIELRISAAPHLGPRGIEVEATLANFGDQPLKEEPITLRVDGKAVAKGLIDLPVSERVTKRFFHVLEADAPIEAPREGKRERESERDAPTEPRVHELSVELAPDDLPDDDKRYARIEARREVRVLLIDGDPRTVRREDEIFYLETALHPGERSDTQLAVQVITMDDLVRRRLDDEDVIFVANAKAPDAERAQLLDAFVTRGGGLFLSAGDNVDPDAWNSALGQLLPQPFASVRTVGATLQARDDGEARVAGEGERIARFDRRHPVLAPFEGANNAPSATTNAPPQPSGATAPNPPAPSTAPAVTATPGAADQGSAQALREARISRYVLLRPTPEGEKGERNVLLRLESGAPLLVEGQPKGKPNAGRVMLLTTTVDRDWSDLAIQPAFLPLVQQAARYLARAPLTGPELPALVGQAHDIPLGEGDARVEVTLPSGGVRWFGEDRVAGRKTLHFTETDEPGLYKIAAGRRAGGLEPRPASSFVVNVDSLESNLAAIPAARLAELSRPTAESGAPAPRHRVHLWHALGAILLALLLLEGALTTASLGRLRPLFPARVRRTPQP